MAGRSRRLSRARALRNRSRGGETLRIYVTGIGGFVGRHLVRELLEHGHEVGGCDLSGRSSGTTGVAVDRVDLLEPDALRQPLATFSPDVVVHLAGFSHVGGSWSSPGLCFQLNVLGTEHVLDALPEQTRLVFASSSEVYGHVPAEEQPISDGRTPAPSNPYGLTKAAAERLVLGRGDVVVRSFNLIGSGQSPEFALPSFARQLALMASGQAPPILRVGNLSPRRDFVDVRDGVAAYRILAERGEAKSYNVATGSAVTIETAVERLIALSGVQATVFQDSDRLRPGDVPLIEGDAARLRELGWQPRYDLDESLVELWRDAQREIESGASSPPEPPTEKR